MHNKVLIISGTPIISGAEYVLGDYLRNNKKLKNIQILHSDIDKVSDYYSQFEFDRRYKSKFLNPVGVVGNSKLNTIKKLSNLFLSFFIFFKVFRDKSIKKVLGNNTGDTVYSLYSYMFGKKHINYIHDMIEPNSIIAKSILFFDKFVYKYVAVSIAVKKALEAIGIDKNKIEVIYNGLEYNQVVNYKQINKTMVFGFVGNIDNKKNPLEFLKFIELVQNTLKDKDIIGKMVYGNILDESLYNKIKTQIKTKRLNAKLIGPIKKEKMDKFYDSIHFLVLTSRKDSLPTVILESFNSGVPAIGHNIDGVPEIIIDGYNGFLYDNDSEFCNIAKKLKNLDYQKLQYNANATIKNKFSSAIKNNKISVELFND